MALATYADLQTQIANWIARADLTSYIPDFITLFETQANRRLRTRAMETFNTLTPSASGIVALPSDYLMFREVIWNGSTTRVLEYVHPAYFQAAYPTSPTNVPRVFTIIGGFVHIAPIDTTTLTFVYFQKIPALSLGANWLITTYPDVYLYGSLAEAYGFMKDADNMAIWQSRRDQGFDEIEKLDQKTRGPAQVQVVGWTP